MKHSISTSNALLCFRLFMLFILSLIMQNGLSQSWSLSGNSNANDSSKLGTTNGEALRFYTNNTQRMSIDNSGRVAMGGYDATHASVLLELNSTTRGFLMPRMTQSQRIAIINPVNGLFVFQTDHVKGLYYYLNGVWISVTSPGANQNLSNLIAPTSINASLLPNSSSLTLGSFALGWGSIFLNGDGIIYKDGIKFLWTRQASTFLGYDTGTFMTSGDDEVGVGYRALYTNTTGSKNVAVGVLTLRDNTTGSDNVAIGASAMSRNIFGNRNIAIGTDALAGNKGQNNTAVGYKTMNINTSGQRNAAFGYLALSGNTEGADNCAIGSNAMLNNRIGFNNTAIGSGSLVQNIAGTENTAIGVSALAAIQFGAYNTSIGAYSGVSGSTSFTSCTLVGYSSYCNGPNIFNSTALGAHSFVTASNQVRIGSMYETSIGGFSDWTNFSDGRYKKNLKESVPGLEFINMLRPVTYNLDVEALQSTLKGSSNVNSGVDAESQALPKTDNQPSLQKAADLKANVVYTGFVAQEVEAAAKKLSFDFSGVDKPKNENDFYGLRYSEFVVPLVKAVQELDQENKKLKEELQELKQIVLDIKNGVSNNNNQNSNSSNYLDQNVPNPFRSLTTIKYYISDKYSSAAIVIINNAGQIIKSYSINQKGSGQIILDGVNFSSGIYTYVLYLDGKPSVTKQLVIAK